MLWFDVNRSQTSGDPTADRLIPIQHLQMGERATRVRVSYRDLVKSRRLSATPGSEGLQLAGHLAGVACQGEAAAFATQATKAVRHARLSSSSGIDRHLAPL